MLKVLKKIFKWLLWLVLIIIVIANLIIIFSGRTYIYKGVWVTYFQGHIQPTIYDDDVFENRTISKGESNSSGWIEHEKLGQIKMSQKQHAYLENLNPSSFLIILSSVHIGGEINHQAKC